jgi:hypothetical protein
MDCYNCIKAATSDCAIIVEAFLNTLMQLRSTKDTWGGAGSRPGK